MKIYKLARELGVDREALLFFAQNQKIEVKSIAAELTSEDLITTGATGKEEGAGKQSVFKGFFSGLKKYEKKTKEPEIPKTKTVKEGKALRIYRLVVILIIGLFVGLGYSAYNANVQVTDLTQKVNETTQTLVENQKTLSKEEWGKLEQNIYDYQSKDNRAISVMSEFVSFLVSLDQRYSQRLEVFLNFLDNCVRYVRGYAEDLEKNGLSINVTLDRARQLGSMHWINGKSYQLKLEV